MLRVIVPHYSFYNKTFFLFGVGVGFKGHKGRWEDEWD